MVPGDELTSGWRRVNEHAAARPAPSGLLHLSALLVSAAMLIVAVSGSRSLMGGEPVSGSPPPIVLDFSNMPVASPAVFPREIVMLEPTSTPPPPRPTPPKPPTIYCGINARPGESCVWPPPTRPPAPPLPDCGTPVANEQCWWTGTPVARGAVPTHFPPTPTPAPSGPGMP